MTANSKPTEVALFITCLTDLFFPDVGEDVVWLLRQAGLKVTFPAGQTCCGQPSFNAGFHSEAREVAAHFLDVFASAPTIVTPSGSCAMMVKKEYPHLFHDDPQRLALAESVAARTYELSYFLVQIMEQTEFGARWQGRAAYHDACHLSRGLGITAEPRTLLAKVAGLELVELVEPRWCCGFGGAFAAKQSAISGAMLDEKIRHIEASNVDTVITSDAGCIIHMAGGLQRQGKPIKVLHFAQVLSGYRE